MFRRRPGGFCFVHLSSKARLRLAGHAAPSAALRNHLHRVHKLSAREWSRQFFAVTLVKRNYFIHLLAQLGEDDPLVGSMASTVEQFGATADPAVILV